MSMEKQKPAVISLLATSFSVLFRHPIIFLPFCWIAFFQLLCLELILFIPRAPWAGFFQPIVSKLWSSYEMHYPANFQLVPRLFQYVQFPLYIFISSVFIAGAIALVGQINKDDQGDFKACMKLAFSKYVYVVFAALISFGIIYLFSQGYEKLVDRAFQIRSTSGKFFIIKKLVINGEPFANLFLSVLSTTFMAFVLPSLMLARNKMLPALKENVKFLFSSGLTAFGVILLPSLLYIPVLMARGTFSYMVEFPEFTVILLMISVVMIAFIDAVVNTALTLLYILKKDDA